MRVLVALVLMVMSCERAEQPTRHSSRASELQVPKPEPERSEPVRSLVSGAPSAQIGQDPDGCPAQVGDEIPTDLYAAITKGTEHEQTLAALAILTSRATQSRAVIQRAIYVVSQKPSCSHLRPLTDTLQDSVLDDATRVAAALALGAIARDFPCTFPSTPCPQAHDPIPQFAQIALRQCSDRKPTMVARACVEALGYVRTADLAHLRSLRDDSNKDALLRIFAGRALSRLTQTRQVSAASLTKLLEDAHKVQP